MAITTFAELKTSIASWLGRDDLTTYIPDFITLFEAAAARRLKVRPQETTTTLTPSSGSVALPTDYAGSVRLTWTGSPRQELRYVHPSYLQGRYPDSPSDVPRIYTIEGGNILIRPVDDTALEFLYVQKTAALSGALNWLFTNHPDIYLFGSLVEAEAFNKDPEKASLWKARRDELFDEILSNDFNERPTMSINVVGYTP